jgi:transcriptional regulator with XRE-family HTH domain
MGRKKLSHDNPLHATLKELREHNNLTQRQVGLAVDLSPITISGWEIGKSLPDIRIVPKLAELFGVSLDRLFGLSTAQSPPAPPVIFAPVFRSLQLWRGKIQCHDHLGTWPIPASLLTAAGSGGLLFVTAPPSTDPALAILPGDLVALFIDQPVSPGQHCGVCIDHELMRLIVASEATAGPGRRIIGPIAGVWRCAFPRPE